MIVPHEGEVLGALHIGADPRAAAPAGDAGVIESRPDTAGEPGDDDPLARALREGRRFVCDDIAAESRPLPWRREALAREMGGPDKVKRQHDGGKLTVRERIDRLLDPGSFHEIGALTGVARYAEDGATIESRSAGNG